MRIYLFTANNARDFLRRTPRQLIAAPGMRLYAAFAQPRCGAAGAPGDLANLNLFECIGLRPRPPAPGEPRGRPPRTAEKFFASAP